MSDTPSKPVSPDLAQLRERIATTSDAGRPEAVARRRRTGQRTARENIADLVDPDSFIEYGGRALVPRVDMQMRNGVIDVRVRDEAEAVAHPRDARGHGRGARIAAGLRAQPRHGARAH